MTKVERMRVNRGGNWVAFWGSARARVWLRPKKSTFSDLNRACVVINSEKWADFARLRVGFYDNCLLEAPR